MLIKADQVNEQNKTHLVMSRLEREMLEEREEREPKEYHYTTEREELEDRGLSYSDFI